MASKRTSIRIPDDLYARLSERAKQERRTVSNMLVAILSAELMDGTRTAQRNIDARIDSQSEEGGDAQRDE